MLITRPASKPLKRVWQREAARNLPHRLNRLAEPRMNRTENNDEWWSRAAPCAALDNATASNRLAVVELDPQLRADLQRVVDGTMTLRDARQRALARTSSAQQHAIAFP
jgi:Antitoxin VbhA